MDLLIELDNVEITTQEKLKILGRYPKEAEEYEQENYEEEDYYKGPNYDHEQEEFCKQEYDVNL